jgi:hypothetical protein
MQCTCRSTCTRVSAICEAIAAPSSQAASDLHWLDVPALCSSSGSSSSSRSGDRVMRVRLAHLHAAAAPQLSRQQQCHSHRSTCRIYDKIEPNYGSLHREHKIGQRLESPSAHSIRAPIAQVCTLAQLNGRIHGLLWTAAALYV